MRIGDDDRVADAAQGRAQPFALLVDFVRGARARPQIASQQNRGQRDHQQPREHAENALVLSHRIQFGCDPIALLLQREFRA